MSECTSIKSPPRRGEGEGRAASGGIHNDARHLVLSVHYRGCGERHENAGVPTAVLAVCKQLEQPSRPKVQPRRTCRQLAQMTARFSVSPRTAHASDIAVSGFSTRSSRVAHHACLSSIDRITAWQTRYVTSPPSPQQRNFMNFGGLRTKPTLTTLLCMLSLEWVDALATAGRSSPYKPSL